MSDITYMRSTTVASVGDGAITDANGCRLQMIGNLPVQPGDTVWTDGHIVYGHRPVRPSVKPLAQQGGIPFACTGEDRPFGYILRNGRVILLSEMEQDDDYTIYMIHNWLYTDPSKLYYEYFYAHGVGTDFYLDIFCTPQSVFTAEYDRLDAPFRGMPYTSMKENVWGIETEYRDAAFLAINMYFQQNGQNFDFNWDASGYVYSNPKVSIKRNGQEIGSFVLEDYLFAVDKLQEIYLAYDASGEDIKRYRWRGRLGGKGPYSLDVFVGFAMTQILHFHFTDAAGNWEMIILSLAEGSCAPHTVDEEYNSEEEEYENVYSFFSFIVPVVYQVWRIKSDGVKELLQEWTVIKPLANNGVSKNEWVNAKAFPVEPVNVKRLLPFDVDFGDCVMNTDLCKINHIIDRKGDVIAHDLPLESFLELYVTNPNGTLGNNGTMGAVNSQLTINLRTGAETVTPAGSHWTHCFGFCPEFDGAGAQQDLGDECINIGPGHPSYFGRLSICPLSDNKSVVSLYLQDLWVIEDGRPTNTIPYSLNHNLCKMSSLREIKKKGNWTSIPGIKGLIESRTGTN